MKMSQETLSMLGAFTAAVWLGIAAIHGVSALKANNEVTTAEATAQALNVTGNSGQAVEYMSYANKEGDQRDHDLILVALDLGVTAIFGAAAGGNIANAREDRKKVTKAL